MSVPRNISITKFHAVQKRRSIHFESLQLSNVRSGGRGFFPGIVGSMDSCFFHVNSEIICLLSFSKKRI